MIQITSIKNFKFGKIKKLGVDLFKRDLVIKTENGTIILNLSSKSLSGMEIYHESF